MGAIGGAFAVVAEQVVAGNVAEAGDAGGFEFFKAFAQGGVVGGVVGVALREDPGVGVAPVLDEHDGRRGMRGAELVDERDALRADGGGVHVGQAVDHEDGGIDLDEKVAHGGVHATVAREAEVDDGAVEAAAEDRGVDHAGARRAGAVVDRGAVEHDGLGGAWGEGFELCVGRHADREALNAVVEREIEGVFAQAGGELTDDQLFHGFFVRAADAGPAPLAVGVARVKIEPAGADGRHVDAVEFLFEHGDVGRDGGGVGFEADHHAGAVAAEIPDGGRDFAFGAGGEAVEPTFAFHVAESAALRAPSGDIVPCECRRVRRGRGRRGGGSLGEGRRGEREGGEQGSQAGVKQVHGENKLSRKSHGGPGPAQACGVPSAWRCTGTLAQLTLRS